MTAEFLQGALGVQGAQEGDGAQGPHPVGGLVSEGVQEKGIGRTLMPRQSVSTGAGAGK
jgi:hypothetical protein